MIDNEMDSEKFPPPRTKLATAIVHDCGVSMHVKLVPKYFNYASLFKLPIANHPASTDQSIEGE